MQIAARSLALRERGLFRRSSSPACTGFLVSTVQRSRFWKARFTSRSIVVVPQAKLALALLTNSDVGNSGASLHTAVTNSLIDFLLGLPKTDWNALYIKVADKADAEAKAEKQKKLEQRQPGTKPSHDLAAYAGKYEDAAYGTVDIMRDKDVLTLHWSGFRKPLDHFHFDTFIVKAGDEEDLDAEQVLFRLGSNGTVESLRFLEVDFQRKQAVK